ncbi:MAG TPA: alpha-ketoglutarate-dependent dioxygenase AlkB [Spongiibacteraceae bacterium]|jgi:alkylated DNA repair dioxygenase AlkB|nr:alpha-ketoglutarate-dependent dioxygenase AlkB [Spongiibacteraceae bacterium]HUH39048.1 alpha-ketoglutarate-dependent dioxygenase AlkB [Spongiibacteraceae bacterium]
MQAGLLDNTWHTVALPGAELRWLPGAVAEHQALYTQLCAELAWGRERLTIFGREHPVPRLMAWYGEADAHYRYSGVAHQPLPWTPTLAALRAQVEALSGVAFNSVLANWYRDGADGMGRHSDDEPELGAQPVIASLSLGASRRFVLHRRDKSLPSHTLLLHGGSLLIMAGTTQQYWQHSLPRTRKPVDGRINLTFRWIHADCGRR